MTTFADLWRYGEVVVERKEQTYWSQAAMQPSWLEPGAGRSQIQEWATVFCTQVAIQFIDIFSLSIYLCKNKQNIVRISISLMDYNAVFLDIVCRLYVGIICI